MKKKRMIAWMVAMGCTFAAMAETRDGIRPITLDEAITLGCASKMAEKGMDFMTDSVKELIERVANPTDSARASKYKQLYFNQRMITAHLESALQFANAQVATYETGEEPFTSPLSKSLGNVLGAAALGMGSFCQSVKEKQLD